MRCSGPPQFSLNTYLFIHCNNNIIGILGAWPNGSPPKCASFMPQKPLLSIGNLILSHQSREQGLGNLSGIVLQSWSVQTMWLIRETSMTLWVELRVRQRVCPSLPLKTYTLADLRKQYSNNGIRSGVIVSRASSDMYQESDDGHDLLKISANPLKFNDMHVWIILIKICCF